MNRWRFISGGETLQTEPSSAAHQRSNHRRRPHLHHFLEHWNAVSAFIHLHAPTSSESHSKLKIGQKIQRVFCLFLGFFFFLKQEQATKIDFTEHFPEFEVLQPPSDTLKHSTSDATKCQAELQRQQQSTQVDSRQGVGTCERTLLLYQNS